MSGDLSHFTRGARLLRRMRELKPGERYRVSRYELLDVVVPASIWDRQTPEFLMEWFQARMPFYCTLHHDVFDRFWEIQRPPSERISEVVVFTTLHHDASPSGNPWIIEAEAID